MRLQDDTLFPQLEFAFETRLSLASRLRLDNPPVGGSRLSVPVLEGRFEGHA